MGRPGRGEKKPCFFLAPYVDLYTDYVDLNLEVGMRITYPIACVLQALASGFHYGFDIMEFTDLPSGTVYPILRRFEANGFVQSRWESLEEALTEGRPRRRYYELTAAGREALSVAAERFRQHERIFRHKQSTHKTS
jgi:DNA-binding MarR family transcriptional regulator